MKKAKKDKTEGINKFILKELGGSLFELCFKSGFLSLMLWMCVFVIIYVGMHLCRWLLGLA